MVEVSDLELARVEELATSVDVAIGGSARWFDATLTDGTKCRVSVAEEKLHCHRHGVGDCEGCRRVLFVLTGEKKKALALTLLGYELNGSEAPPVEMRPSRLLSLTR